jgi:Phycobilisome Linker polypeptide/EF hand
MSRCPTLKSVVPALLFTAGMSFPSHAATPPTSQQPEVWSDREDTFENLDTNRNGRIDRNEWQASADAFQWLDRNNDGSISRSEFVGNRRDATQRPRNRRDPVTRGTSGSENCTSSAPQVVDDAYQQVLERSADEASAQLTQALASGRMTVRDVVRELAKSPEHAERFFWQPAVQHLYRRLLGRDADPEGLQVFTARARTSGLGAAERDIMASPEFRQRAGGGVAASAPGDNTAAYEAAVRSLYRHLLGRDPDPVGLRDLTQTAMRNNFDAVIDRMLSSQEYDRLVGDNRVPGRNITYCGPTR